jgi:hypothetical protein
LLAVALALLQVYFYLEFVLSHFPWNRGIADQLVGVARLATVHVFCARFSYLPNLVNVFVTIMVARYMLKAVKGSLIRLPQMSFVCQLQRARRNVRL